MPRPETTPAAGETKSAPAAAKRTPIKTIKAEPGKPWPDPPHGGQWERDPDTGDLHLMCEFKEPDAEELAKRRQARQEAAARDHAKNEAKE